MIVPSLSRLGPGVYVQVVDAGYREPEPEPDFARYVLAVSRGDAERYCRRYGCEAEYLVHRRQIEGRPRGLLHVARSAYTLSNPHEIIDLARGQGWVIRHELSTDQ